MPLMDLPGSDDGNAGADRLHNFGTNPASHSFTRSASGALKFVNGTPRTFAFDENRNRRLSIHSVLVPQRSVAREYVCPRKRASEQVPMEIRVEVHEETKKDYDSMYTASVLQAVESVSVALWQTIALHSHSRSFYNRIPNPNQNTATSAASVLLIFEGFYSSVSLFPRAHASIQRLCKMAIQPECKSLVFYEI